MFKMVVTLDWNRWNASSRFIHVEFDLDDMCLLGLEY